MTKKNNKYFIWVLGCQMNKSDGERIESVLSQIDYVRTDNEKSADLIVVVACSIKQTAIDRIFGKSKNWQKKRKAGKLSTILTGCVVERDKKKMEKIFDLVLDVKEINKIPQKLSSLKVIDVASYFHIDPRRKSDFQAYVPIMTGCNNFCTYCIVPYTRGREVSRSSKEIITECKKLIKDGYKEITLLGQNVNSYKSGAHDFSKLLRAVDSIEGDFWIRFVSSHPKDCSPALIKTMASGKHISPYLHFAVQSGDNYILKKMNRQYTVAQYIKLVNFARKLIPDLMVSTDFIVGFPGETRKQFENSARLIGDLKFDMAYISKYSPRVGTVSADMEDSIKKIEKVRRNDKLNRVLEKGALQNNEKDVGKTLRVLVESCKKGRCIGKSFNYKTVYFSGESKLIGQFVNIKIIKADNWGLKGEVAKKKLVVVLGPTACGKTQIATKLATKYNGEIIAADSRQVFRGMDIGTGKDLKDYGVGDKQVPYHLIDVVSPKTNFSVARYQKLAYSAIDEVLERGGNPFLVGGTGLYIDAVTRGYVFSDSVNKKERLIIRKKLDKLSLSQLLLRLKKIDSITYKTIDKKNRRRVQRALEIFYETGKTKSQMDKSKTPDYEILFLGVKFPLDKIYHKIDYRLDNRIDEGMVREVKRLRKDGVSWKRLDEFGLEYRWVSRYLQGKITHPEMVENLKSAIHHFAKRQLTWFKRNKDIIWIDSYEKAEKEVKKFLK